MTTWFSYASKRDVVLLSNSVLTKALNDLSANNRTWKMNSENKRYHVVSLILRRTTSWLLDARETSERASIVGERIYRERCTQRNPQYFGRAPALMGRWPEHAEWHSADTTKLKNMKKLVLKTVAFIAGKSENQSSQKIFYLFLHW